MKRAAFLGLLIIAICFTMPFNALGKRKKKKPAESPPPPAAKIKGGPMVEVPSGEFMMGCNEDVDRSCAFDEKPYHKINLTAFQIDQNEVTVARYRECVEAGKCSTNGLNTAFWEKKEKAEWSWACNWGKTDRESHPINCVSWSQAKDYCEWAEKRLPTEAEWEKAARGTSGWKYPWGNTGYNASGKVANIADETAFLSQSQWIIAEGYDDGFYDTAPVGSFPAGVSPFQAYDMVGNVREWVADWYDKSYYRKSPIENPAGPESGKNRVQRGGAWDSDADYARASVRFGAAPDSRSPTTGFRCAK